MDSPSLEILKIKIGCLSKRYTLVQAQLLHLKRKLIQRSPISSVMQEECQGQKGLMSMNLGVWALILHKAHYMLDLARKRRCKGRGHVCSFHSLSLVDQSSFWSTLKSPQTDLNNINWIQDWYARWGSLVLCGTSDTSSYDGIQRTCKRAGYASFAACRDCLQQEYSQLVRYAEFITLSFHQYIDKKSKSIEQKNVTGA